MQSLKVVTRANGDAIVLSVQGEVDLATAAELETALRRALETPTERLVVDLREVQFMDSTGLAMLVEHDRLAREAGRRLIVVKGPPQVQRAFDVTGLSTRLTMVDEPPPARRDPEGRIAAPPAS
jgi:anti-sigma B factor antagonist